MTQEQQGNGLEKEDERPRNTCSGAPTNGVQSVEQSMPEQKKKRRKKEKRG